MPNVMIILAVGALICAIISLSGKLPIWVAVILLCFFACLLVLPK